MLFEQYQVDDLFTPSLIDGGVLAVHNSEESGVPSPDFFLTDSSIDAFFPVSLHSKQTKNDFCQHQEEDEIFPELDLSNIDLDNLSGLTMIKIIIISIISFSFSVEFLTDPFNDESLDISKFISEVSFPSPVDSTDFSPMSSSDESTMTNDRIVPPSPTMSTGSTKRSKLNPVERKIRKKKQNKNAAEKYRVKKKSERDQLLDRHGLLKSFNQNLKLEMENLTFQVQQLKQLLVDVVQVPLPPSK